MPKYIQKQTTPIDFKRFADAMENGRFTQRSHRSYFVFLYWFGVRRGEALSMVPELFKVVDGLLIVDCAPEKGGAREPLEVPVGYPYVNLIIERVNDTLPGERLWRFSTRTAVNIVKATRLNKSLQIMENNIPMSFKAFKGHGVQNPIIRKQIMD